MNLEPAARQVVLQTAATSIQAKLGLVEAAPPEATGRRGVLGEPRASFVTLTIDGELRGCCGTLEPVRPLLLDVWSNAQASAFRDPRFPPLTAREWRCTSLEVSLLTPCERMAVSTEQQLLLELVPGRDGLVFEWRGLRATFLPKVWEHVAGPRDFLHRLKEKAGLRADFWAADVQVWRYETEIMAVERPATLEAAPPGPGMVY
ncbi:MAG: AmmeMemoRadiSam system protein A [Steroidobacteraceae bacterium]